MHSGLFVTALRAVCNAKTLKRGWAYYLADRVHDPDLTGAGELEATVQGSEPYAVTLGISSEGLWGDCTCPALRRMDACKHMVALALWADESGLSRKMLGTPARTAPVDRAPAAPSWRERLSQLEQGAHQRREATLVGDPVQPATFELWIDPDTCRAHRGLVLELMRVPALAAGGFAEPRSARWVAIDGYRSMPRDVYVALARVSRLSERASTSWSLRDTSKLLVAGEDACQALQIASAAVALRCVDARGERGPPLVWAEETWQFCLHAVRDEQPLQKPGSGDEATSVIRVEGLLQRASVRRPLSEARLLLSGGLVLFADEAAPLDAARAFDWILSLRRGGPLIVREEDLEVFLTQLLDTTFGVPLDLGELALPPETPTGAVDLMLRRDALPEARVSFEYGAVRVSAADPRQHVILAGPPARVLGRNADAERLLLDAFAAAGGTRHGPDWLARPYRLPADGLGDRCSGLIQAGWRIEVESKPLRSGGALSMRVRSGIDWFDLEGQVTFEASALPLPAILEAVSEGRRVVTLPDGGSALLAPEWVARLEALGALAGRVPNQDHVRVARARGPLLDVLLAGFTDVAADAGFKRLQSTLRRFNGVRPRKEPAAFQGALRPYQREALGWFEFLRRAGLGGCLADDMGLGKTVQVLACLLPRRRAKGRRGPSLVVAPRSVLSNWIREGERFAPSVRSAIYHGPARGEVLERLSRLDLIVTTYATMRGDISCLAQIPFDYVVLDESQAIKNSASKTAQAACRLDATHRLALSGTPIENHLEELGSLFAFLNPGLLGSRSEFTALMGTKGAPSPERLAWLQAAIRPVMLRRTREEVLTELPDKEEQIMRCPLPAIQRKAYNAIRDHYRASVLSKVEQQGLARTKLHVLEALLRLRQAACHPGLIDRTRREEGAAKLDQLLPMLEEIADAGHKALVFSQFTKFLAIVRERLDARGIRYEYMDGRTRKRAACIDRFQDDPQTSAFLISLKAGGTGLNLTAAQYVFLLDPWWNPAVEAQAVGRAHRMGQQNPVTVYRLIGEDTVEDHVLELQARKRELVQAVLGGVSDAPLRNITRTDLERLLG